MTIIGKCCTAPDSCLVTFCLFLRVSFLLYHFSVKKQCYYWEIFKGLKNRISKINWGPPVVTLATYLRFVFHNTIKKKPSKSKVKSPPQHYCYFVTLVTYLGHKSCHPLQLYSSLYCTLECNTYKLSCFCGFIILQLLFNLLFKVIFPFVWNTLHSSLPNLWTIQLLWSMTVIFKEGQICDKAFKISYGGRGMYFRFFFCWVCTLKPEEFRFTQTVVKIPC